MIHDVVPNASPLDLQHFQTMMDVDKNSLISLKEFLDALEESRQISERAKTPGGDDEAVLQRLHDYLTDNDAILQEYFRWADKDSSGESMVMAACSTDLRTIVSSLFPCQRHAGSRRVGGIRAVYPQHATRRPKVHHELPLPFGQEWRRQAEL